MLFDFALEGLSTRRLDLIYNAATRNKQQLSPTGGPERVGKSPSWQAGQATSRQWFIDGRWHRQPAPTRPAGGNRPGLPRRV